VLRSFAKCSRRHYCFFQVDWISRNYSIAILHELIQLNLLAENEEHKERFTAERKRLMSAGAYDSLL